MLSLKIGYGDAGKNVFLKNLLSKAQHNILDRSDSCESCQHDEYCSTDRIYGHYLHTGSV